VIAAYVTAHPTITIAADLDELIPLRARK